MKSASIATTTTCYKTSRWNTTKPGTDGPLQVPQRRHISPVSHICRAIPYTPQHERGAGKVARGKHSILFSFSFFRRLLFRLKPLANTKEMYIDPSIDMDMITYPKHHSKFTSILLLLPIRNKWTHTLFYTGARTRHSRKNSLRQKFFFFRFFVSTRAITITFLFKKKRGRNKKRRIAFIEDDNPPRARLDTIGLGRRKKIK